jgi:predicted TIM-barrel fold metal-dependent hydrolase
VGSDYPFDMGLERPSEIVHALDLTEIEKVKILHKNAAKLFA